MSGVRRGRREAVGDCVHPPHTTSWLRDVVLSHDDADAIRRWADAFDADPYCDDFSTYDRPLCQRLNGLPRHFIDGVGDFGTAANEAGVLRLRGIPIPQMLPPTPAVPYSQVRARIGTEPVMLALAMLVGRAMSLPQMRSGHRVHNIYPLPGDADTQKASNSVLLELHTEMAFQDSPPDALAILCLRASDTPPATSFCDMRMVWDGLAAREQSLLQEPSFAFRYTGPDRGRQFFDPHPVARVAAGRLRIEYDCAACGLTPEHDAALGTLRDRAADAVSELTLAVGDLVVIDNRRMAHGRSPMSPGYAGTDRWLQRCLIRLKPLPSAANRPAGAFAALD